MYHWETRPPSRLSPPPPAPHWGICGALRVSITSPVTRMSLLSSSMPSSALNPPAAEHSRHAASTAATILLAILSPPSRRPLNFKQKPLCTLRAKNLRPTGSPNTAPLIMANKEALPKFQGLGGLGILLILMWTAILGSLGLLFPAMALLLLPFEWSRRAFRAWSMLVATQWFVLATLLLEKWAGVRIIVSGDVPSQRGEPAMIICNHRTRIDWMFLWSLCYRLGILKSMKITLKDSLKSLPGFGWAMQCFLFVFLARDKCKDLQHMQEIIDYHTQNNHPVSLILFPEGTDLSSRNLMESNAYASRKGLQKYRHVLHPKVVGWSRSVSLLRHTCRYVYDVTIAYKDFMPGERPSELSILTARYPKEVHIHMDRYATSSLPDAPADLENWCRTRFAAKEKLLTMFYGENGGSLGAEARCPVPESERVGCWMTAVMFWSTMTVTSLFSLVIIIGWFWVFWALVAWILITRWGGVDALELRLHGSRGVFKKMLKSETSSD